MQQKNGREQECIISEYGQCVGFDIPLKYEFADDTKDSEYILVHENGFPVSTCRVRIDEENAGHIERVATLEEYEGKHYGALGIKAAEQL